MFNTANDPGKCNSTEKENESEFANPNYRFQLLMFHPT